MIRKNCSSPEIVSQLRNYGKLMRVDKTVGIWLLMWPTLWALWIAGEGNPDQGLFLVFMAGVFFMRSAGCVLNDFVDRKIDPYVERTRTRPLATGAVAPYEALKARISERLLEALYEKLPQLRGQVDFHELSTPLSTDWFCRYPRGEIYGLDHDPERFAQDWLRPKTEIPGLYLAGQDVVSCGVVGAMVGGLLAAVQLGGLKGWRLAWDMFARA